MLDYFTLSDTVDYVNKLPQRLLGALKTTELFDTPLVYKLMRFNRCLELVHDEKVFVVCGLLIDYVLVASDVMLIDRLPQYTLKTYVEEYRRLINESDRGGRDEFITPFVYKADAMYEATYQILLAHLGCAVGEAPSLKALLEEFYGWLFNALVDLVSRGYRDVIEVLLSKVTSNLSL